MSFHKNLCSLWKIDNSFYSSDEVEPNRKRQRVVKESDQKGDDKICSFEKLKIGFQKSLIDSFVTSNEIYERFKPNEEIMYVDYSKKTST